MKPTKKIGSPEEPDPTKTGQEDVERGEIVPREEGGRRAEDLDGDEGGGGGYGRPRENDDEDNHI